MRNKKAEKIALGILTFIGREYVNAKEHERLSVLRHCASSKLDKSKLSSSRGRVLLPEVAGVQADTRGHKPTKRRTQRGSGRAAT